MASPENSEKKSEFQMGIEPTTLRDPTGCSEFSGDAIFYLYHLSYTHFGGWLVRIFDMPQGDCVMQLRNVPSLIIWLCNRAMQFQYFTLAHHSLQ